MLKNKILGALIGGATGDAMGAATEMRSPALIKEFFGDYVTRFIQAPEDTFARGAVAGFVTDDFSLAYFTAKEIVKSGGLINNEVAEACLLEWASHPEYFDKYAGPSTRAAIQRLKGEEVEEKYGFLACNNAAASNGAAMKIGPAGMFCPGDIDKAIEAAITIIRPSHNNDLSLSGGCAVAAAVSCAMQSDTTTLDILNAGIYGAREGYKRAQSFATRLAGPSVEKRISLAAEIGLRYSNDHEKAMLEIGDIIGASLHISEAVPAAFGLMVATDAHPTKAIELAVNVGNDTDTVAAIVGYMVGAHNGADAYDEYYLNGIEAANHFELAALAEEMAALVEADKITIVR